MMAPMELMLAGVVIVVSLLLAAWQERPVTQRASSRQDSRPGHRR
ncbi:hypothetical protein [Deinococcus yunweiensis]